VIGCIVSCSGQVLLFFKYYDPMTGVISYMGHYVEFIVNKLGGHNLILKNCRHYVNFMDLLCLLWI